MIEPIKISAINEYIDGTNDDIYESEYTESFRSCRCDE